MSTTNAMFIIRYSLDSCFFAECFSRPHSAGKIAHIDFCHIYILLHNNNKFYMAGLECSISVWLASVVLCVVPPFFVFVNPMESAKKSSSVFYFGLFNYFHIAYDFILGGARCSPLFLLLLVFWRDSSVVFSCSYSPMSFICLNHFSFRALKSIHNSMILSFLTLPFTLIYESHFICSASSVVSSHCVRLIRLLLLHDGLPFMFFDTITLKSNFVLYFSTVFH